MIVAENILKTRKMRRKLNDKGMSLVEVMIAVVILAIAVGATMRLFVDSASYDARSRQHQRAIAVAESAMESFKAYDLDELCLQFGAGSGGAVFNGVSSDGLTTRTVTASNSSGLTVDPLDAEDELNDEVTNYYFTIDDAIEDGKRYDVKINVTRADAREMFDMKSINTYTDAVVQFPESETAGINAKIQGEALTDLAGVSLPSDIISGGSLSISNVNISSLERKFKLEIVHDATTDSDQVVMAIDYIYSGTYDYQYVSSSSGVQTVSGRPFSGTKQHVFDETTGQTTLSVYDNSGTIATSDGKIKNMYFYYYPMYADAVEATSAKDIIEVNGGTIPADSDSQVQVHIAKQKATLYGSTLFNTYEATYHVETTGAGNVALDSNLDECLSGTGTTIPVPVTSGYSENKTLMSGSKETKGVLYNVEVLVYNANETDVIATYKGTMNN